MMGTRVLLAAALLATLPAAASAQGRTCRLLGGATEARRNVTDTGVEFVYVRGRAHWVCSGGISLEADSAVAQPGTGELELIGRVSYSDSIKTLTAGWVKYFGDQERLIARENVVLTDRSTGSVVRGPELEYERQTEWRPQARTIVRGRPHALFYSADSTRAAPDPVFPGGDPDTEDARMPDAGLGAREPLPWDSIRPSVAGGMLPLDSARRPVAGVIPLPRVGGGISPSDSALVPNRDPLPFDRARRVPPDRASRLAADRTGPLPNAPPLPSDSGPPPLEVDADQMEILGENSFHATGRVELVRGEMRGFGREATFDHRTGQLLLREDARIEGERFTLFGRRIEGRLVRDTLREVVARQDALLLADELELQAPELRIFFEEGQMNRLVAWSGKRREAVASGNPGASGDPAASGVADDRRLSRNPGAASRDSAASRGAGDRRASRGAGAAPRTGDLRVSATPETGAAARNASDSEERGVPETGAAAGEQLASGDPGAGNEGTAVRARALASDFRLIADSIDARAPGQRIDRVIAVGDAYAERATDSVAADLAEMVSHDWLRGDTIIGYLRTDTVAVEASDTARRRPEPVPTFMADDTALVVASQAPRRPPRKGRARLDPDTTPADSTIVRQVLERIVAVGGEGKARSLYRLTDEQQDSLGAAAPDSLEASEPDRVARPTINYLVAERITLFLEQGQVQQVDADGPVQGWHAQPKPPSDTTDAATDSAGVALSTVGAHAVSHTSLPTTRTPARLRSFIATRLAATPPSRCSPSTPQTAAARTPQPVGSGSRAQVGASEDAGPVGRPCGAHATAERAPRPVHPGSRNQLAASENTRPAGPSRAHAVATTALRPMMRRPSRTRAAPRMTRRPVHWPFRAWAASSAMPQAVLPTAKLHDRGARGYETGQGHRRSSE